MVLKFVGEAVVPPKLKYTPVTVEPLVGCQLAPVLLLKITTGVVEPVERSPSISSP